MGAGCGQARGAAHGPAGQQHLTGPASAAAPTGAPRVAQISFFRDPQARTPEQLLCEWPSMVDLADAAHEAGVALTVIQASARAQTLQHHGVSYHFLVPPREGGLAHAPGFARLMRSLEPQVLHVHGLGFPVEVMALAALMPRSPILLQDHAGPGPRPWRRRLWRRGFAAAAGVAFSARAQAEPFRRLRLFAEPLRVYEIPESSSRFTPGAQDAARALTGMHGNPCILSVGHLVPDKDPLTVLAGFRAAAAQLPDAHLWFYFGKAPLLGKLRARIAGDALLRERVHLVGSVPHRHIEQAMRAADLFVSGSHHEGSGYALLEAFACALPPVVSDIPSFRSFTADGTVGALWACGDAAAMARALVRLAREPPEALRRATRTHFDRELSFAAVGRKLRASYLDLALLQSAGALHS
ncbi:MAG: glycosyltransferase family 4 protein [Proteobacteria bacterium]|nr:glycosyltransferase family 4 protein [Pseudomonadota bacterium]